MDKKVTILLVVIQHFW